jgi:hypothetical protein
MDGDLNGRAEQGADGACDPRSRLAQVGSGLPPAQALSASRPNRPERLTSTWRPPP